MIPAEVAKKNSVKFWMVRGTKVLGSSLDDWIY
jgi:hypothetical protein